jgi:indole-3-glycerol phosphate synthase
MTATERPSVLAEILRSTTAEVARRRESVPLAALATPGEPSRGPGRRLREALAGPGVSVIAEFKRRSPSAGMIREGSTVEDIARAYASGGAAAMSVLTDGPYFGGSLQDLRAARAACTLPLLRKDFVVDRYQLHEAAASGADAVLLIVAALEDRQLSELFSEATELGLDVLIEVHDREEVGRALAVDAALIGINNRDLRDFSVDVARTYALLADIPSTVLVVSESGISQPSQLHELAAAGVSGVLVGESLMRAPSPEAALVLLRDAQDSTGII